MTREEFEATLLLVGLEVSHDHKYWNNDDLELEVWKGKDGRYQVVNYETPWGRSLKVKDAWRELQKLLKERCCVP